MIDHRIRQPVDPTNITCHCIYIFSPSDFCQFLRFFPEGFCQSRLLPVSATAFFRSAKNLRKLFINSVRGLHNGILDLVGISASHGLGCHKSIYPWASTNPMLDSEYSNLISLSKYCRTDDIICRGAFFINQCLHQCKFCKMDRALQVNLTISIRSFIQSLRWLIFLLVLKHISFYNKTVSLNVQMGCTVG